MFSMFKFSITNQATKNKMNMILLGYQAFETAEAVSEEMAENRDSEGMASLRNSANIYLVLLYIKSGQNHAVYVIARLSFSI